MTPADPEAAQWKKISENARRIDGCNRELGEARQELKALKDDQSNILDAVGRVEGKVDKALEEQNRRSGAENLGLKVIRIAGSFSAAVAALWIWLKQRGG